jgi:hypothetical protein
MSDANEAQNYDQRRIWLNNRTMLTTSSYIAIFFLAGCGSALVNQRLLNPTLLSMASDAAEIDLNVAGKFKIVTCSAVSCAKKRSALRMDPYSTFSAFYMRIKDSDFPNVQIEETSCLGRCRFAPCVAVEHADFDGSVALEGMTSSEFNARVFDEIITDEDANRVWSCVDNAIRNMAEEDLDDLDRQGEQV